MCVSACVSLGDVQSNPASCFHCNQKEATGKCLEGLNASVPDNEDIAWQDSGA